MTRNINKSINNLRRHLQSAPEVRRSKKKSISNLTSNSKARSQPQESDTSQLLWGILIICLVIFIIAFIFHFFVQRSFTEVGNNIIDRTRFLFEKSFQKPQGISDMPSQVGAPVSTEGPPDDTENSYLNLYGSPDAPGFSKYPGHVSPGYRSYSPWGQGYQTNNLPFAGNLGQYPNGGDYYIKERVENISKSRLNEYIRRQNRYIKDVNRRVKDINSDRMYSPEYIRNKAELRYVRNFERRLANKVHRESERQPYLPNSMDSPYL
jgi:hypothetical protein